MKLRTFPFSPSLCLLLAFAVRTGPAETAGPAYKIYKAPSPEERAQVMKRALEFLVKGQHENGAFGVRREVGVSAVVLHALLLCDAEFRSPGNPTTQKALAFLLKHVQPDGRISDGRGYDNYKTSFGVMALSSLSGEQYSKLLRTITDANLISPEKARELAKEKVTASAEKWLTDQQANESTGFDRDRDPGYGGQGYGGVPVPDLSNSHIAMDALHALGARQGHPFFTKLEVFLSRTQNLRQVNDLTDKTKFPELKNYEVQNDGGFAYAPTTSKADLRVTEGDKQFARSYASITAAGLKCLLQLGAKKDDPRVKGAVGWLTRHYTLEYNAGLEAPEDPAKGQQGLYYFYWTFSKAMALLADPLVELPDGKKIDWAGQLAGRLQALQREDGSWLNEQDRWEEGDPCLVTSYCLVAFHFCDEQLKRNR